MGERTDTPESRARTKLRVIVPEEAAGMRLDRYLAEELSLFPRSQIAHRAVTVKTAANEQKLSRRIRAGEELEIEYAEPEAAAILPENVPLNVMFENDDVVVVNKPAGMVVHPAAGNWSGTLVQGLMYHVQSLTERFGDRARPGIVHRLDKDTSGVIVAAKHPEALAALAVQFKKHTTEKHYLAVVKGRLPRSTGTISTRIARDPRNRKRFAVSETGGKEAVTHYRVLKHYDEYSFVSLRPKTGRTHQLRVHMAYVGCPILGDSVYARGDRRFPGASLMLHAYQLTIRLPHEREPRTFTARLPERFREVLRSVAEVR
ncbi:MAG: RluA family pseudouridine synthase [Spirochaetota bacterium]